jgi:hypothetical protein
MTAPGLTGDQISALEMLAGSPKGCTEAEMKTKGFTIALLGALIRLRRRGSWRWRAGRSAL